MITIDSNIETFDELRTKLEAEHTGEWALIHEQQLVGLFPSFDEAAQMAMAKYGRGPYLIRQIGAPPMVLPASVMYHPFHG